LARLASLKASESLWAYSWRSACKN
jgi:hypothetical protein